MTEPSDNLILHLLQEMRTEAVTRDEKTQAQIGVLAQATNDIRVDVKRMADQIHEIAIAVDHHSSRLDRIEQHLGLDSAKH